MTMTPISKHSGAYYLLQGFALLTKPRLRLYVAIPLAINFILFAILIWLGIHYFDELTHWVNHFLPGWLQWLDYLLWALFAIGIGLFFVFCFTMVANIIGAPFNSLLASKVEVYLTNTTFPEESWLSGIKDMPRTLTREWEKFLYFLPRAILCLILFFIPVIQIAAGVIWFLFNGWMMAIQYLDYPVDNHRLPFKTFRTALSHHRMPALGFGTLTMVLSFIPVINCILMPAAVAGATAMWVDVLQNEANHVE